MAEIFYSSQCILEIDMNQIFTKTYGGTRSRLEMISTVICVDWCGHEISRCSYQNKCNLIHKINDLPISKHSFFSRKGTQG
jgi:hypothetical protein